MSQKFSDYLLLHFLVFIWGFAAILGVLIDMPSMEIVFFRTLLSAIGLWVIVFLAGTGFSLKGGKDLLGVIIVGVLIGVHWVLFFLSAKISNVSVCLAGMATTSLWTSILEPIYFKYRIRRFEVILSLLAFTGMVIIFNVELDHFIGLVLAVLSAICAAAFTVLNVTLVKRNDHFVITFYEMAVASAFTLLVYLIIRWVPYGPPMDMIPFWTDWIYLILLAGGCTVFAYSYSNKLMRRISAFNVNLTVNLEPVYGIVFALLIFGEEELMSPGFYIGTIFILSSVLSYPLINKVVKKKPLETDLLR